MILKASRRRILSAEFKKMPKYVTGRIQLKLKSERVGLGLAGFPASVTQGLETKLTAQAWFFHLILAILNVQWVGQVKILNQESWTSNDSNQLSMLLSD